MIVKTKCFFILLSIYLFFIVSCGLFDDNDKDTDCWYDSITVENKCDQEIMIRYNDEPDEFDWVDFIFGVDSCDVVERNVVISPDKEKDITVFLGVCSESEDALLSERCDSVLYWSDESITVQYGDAVRKFFIHSSWYIEISPEDFD